MNYDRLKGLRDLRNTYTEDTENNTYQTGDKKVRIYKKIKKKLMIS